MENDLNYEHRLTEVEQRSKSNTHRLDKLEPVIEEIHNISKTLVEMMTELKHTNETVETISRKVECIEREPATKWKDATKTIVSAIIGALITAAAGGLFWAVVQSMH